MQNKPSAAILLALSLVPAHIHAEKITEFSELLKEGRRCDLAIDGHKVPCSLVVFAQYADKRQSVQFNKGQGEEPAALFVGSPKDKNTISVTRVELVTPGSSTSDDSDAEGECILGMFSMACQARLATGALVVGSIFIEQASAMPPQDTSSSKKPASSPQTDSTNPVATMSAEACRKVMRLHAYLSRAQFQCGFKKYSNALFEKARSCFQSLNESAVEHEMTSGMASFDVSERKQGHKALCNEILKRFPKEVAN